MVQYVGWTNMYLFFSIRHFSSRSIAIEILSKSGIIFPSSVQLIKTSLLVRVALSLEERLAFSGQSTVARE